MLRVGLQRGKWGVPCGALDRRVIRAGKQNQALWLVMSLGCFLPCWHPGRGSRQQRQGECEQGRCEQGECEQGGCEQGD